MYEHEQVDENEVKDLASDLNAVFQKTSAKEANGVEDLFVKIGKKFLNPKGEGNSSGQKENEGKSGDKKDKENIKLSGKKSKEKKKGCC